jgi:hypothetical protein
MVARLKLKEIDGRAPPGVRSALLLKAACKRVGGVLARGQTRLVTEVATSPNCGNTLKLYLPTGRRKASGARLTPGVRSQR